MRAHPDAFLAPNVIVCEGASEVGLIRGLGHHRVHCCMATTIAAGGVSLVDAGGVSKIYEKAAVFQALGYRVMTLRDDDVQPEAMVEEAFEAQGGTVVYWRQGVALEQELFEALADDTVLAMIDYAAGLHGEDVIRANVASTQQGASASDDPRMLLDVSGRRRLGKASKKGSWYKTVSWMEEVGSQIVGPDLARADTQFQDTVARLFAWIG